MVLNPRDSRWIFASDHAGVLRAIDPALDSVLESILTNWEQTIKRRLA